MIRELRCVSLNLLRQGTGVYGGVHIEHPYSPLLSSPSSSLSLMLIGTPDAKLT